jgi:hypothetical protein
MDGHSAQPNCPRKLIYRGLDEPTKCQVFGQKFDIVLMPEGLLLPTLDTPHRVKDPVPLTEEYMSQAFRQPRVLLALVGSCAALCLGLIGPANANAASTPFCNPVTVGAYVGCNGPLIYLNQVYGWGDQHSVCVGIAGLEFAVKRCSSGPGAGVYSGTAGAMQYTPHIENHAAGTNTLHGVALSP